MVDRARMAQPRAAIVTRNTRESIDPDRWNRIQEVLADAIECPRDERDALLDRRCAGDRSLRCEIDSLLLAHDSDGLIDRLQPLVKRPDDFPTLPSLERLAAAATLPVTDWSGRTVARYRVLDAIGSGGMAVVYRARDERLGRHVALKFLSPSLRTDPRAKRAFVAEARAAAALDHPNVCTIYEIDDTEDAQLFIAMPLYEGETLRERLDRGRMPFSDVLPVALQIARGLAHAHDAGIVHRDIKPSNIVILPDGTAKILDFGIAQIHDASRTPPQLLVGTVAYMSPEQARGMAVDCRSDVWSLAVVIHEMLTGSRPFDGADARVVRHAILDGAPQLTSGSYPDVPASLEPILRRALAKTADDRYVSMNAFADDLAGLAADSDRRPALADAEAQARGWTTERRRAAVLVTCVSDYLSLVDEMPAEEAHRLIAQVRDVAVDVAREYGGLVNQAIGEEIVSLFGVPVAHDDDDLRAVRAAMELHARVQNVDPRLRVQSGLHVGVLVARRLHEGPRRYEIAGIPVALACRLAALAEPGSVWVTPQTQRLVAPYVHTVACAPTVIDPHEGSATPFRVLGETGIATRLEVSTRAGLTPYVGRQAELSTVQAHVVRARSGVGSIVAIVGEAGAGKSRLIHELQATLDNQREMRVLRARCRAYADGVPYGVFVQLLCAALELRPPLVSADIVAARIRALDAALEPYVPLFLHLLSMTSDVYTLPKHLRGEHLQAALLDALAMFVGVLSRRQPIVVLVEDWHWADTGSRAAFGRVADLIPTSPVVVIVTSRDEQDAERNWPSAATLVRLERLDFTSSTAIVEAVLGVRQITDALAQRLYERAGGNPFFLEQICTALIEQQAVTVRDGNALVTGGESALVLPHTVQGVIRARLDNLHTEAVEIARIAAVIGWEFEHAVLADVVPVAVDLRGAIAALEIAGLIRRTPDAGTLRYRFTHALTQEVCYDSLVGHQRKTMHGAIGRALASMRGDRVDERAALLAHHFAQAEDWPSAIQFGRRAAERAIELSQFGDALVMLDRAVEWAGRLPEGERGQLADLLLQQERVCETLGLRARQQQIIDMLISHLAREEGTVRLAEVYLRQGDLSTLLKRFDAADRALATALRIGQERGDTVLLRSALRSLGLLRWHEGRLQDALEVTRRVLALDRECDDNNAVALDLTNLGNILRAVGDLEGARARLEEALAMPGLWNDPKKLVYTQHNLAHVYRAMGNHDKALDCLMRNDEIARVHLLPIQRSFHLTSIAHIQLQLGQVDRALDTYRTAVDLSRRARHADGLVQSLRMLGNALLGLARYDEAMPCLDEAAQLFAQLEDRASEAEMRSAIARILERSSPEAAADAWSTLLILHRRRGDVAGELDAREGLARSLRARGPDAAIPAFESALALAATLGERAREAALENILGILEWDRGRYGDALRHYESVLALIRGHGVGSQEALILNSLGACLTKLHRPDEARTVLERSLMLSQELGERQLEAHALTALGHVALNGHDFKRAEECFEESLIIRRTTGDRVGEGWMHLRLADLRTRTGDAAGARAASQAAVAVASETADQKLASACTEQGGGHRAAVKVV